MTPGCHTEYEYDRDGDPLANADGQAMFFAVAEACDLSVRSNGRSSRGSSSSKKADESSRSSKSKCLSGSRRIAG